MNTQKEARKTKWQKLIEYLDKEPDKKATLRDIHQNVWIQNVPDAAKAARKQGYVIETVYDQENSKIASYKLVGEPSSSMNVDVNPGHAVFGQDFCETHKISFPFGTRCPKEI